MATKSTQLLRAADLRVHVRGGPNDDGRGDGPLVILLHGYGAPGDDLLGLYEVLGMPRSFRFAFPEAPLGLDFGGRAWFHIDLPRLQHFVSVGAFDEIVSEIPPGLDQAGGTIVSLVEELQQELGPPSDQQLFLGGFSQGSVTACQAAFCSEMKLAGLVVLSGSLFSREIWDQSMAHRKNLPVFQSHGRDDFVLSYELGVKLHDLFVAHGLKVTWKPFSGGHGITPEVLSSLAQFLKHEHTD